ncbi:MAG TPA: hypothetical protein VFB45_11325 [Pseudolabrys sp.]|nr:hypothetical protein [Pseudolabrys sp.]
MSADSEPTPPQPSADEIRAQVERMIVSDVFSRSVQLGAFLRYVVEALLHGKAERLKAYTIGVEVLRRDVKFDPHIDPIVRVEATRLRHAIERYFAGPGRDDPIIIELPRGSYMPVIRVRKPLEALPAAATEPAPRFSIAARRALFFAAGAIAAITIIGGLVMLAPPKSNESPKAVTGGDANSARQSGNGMPVLTVESTTVIGTPAGKTISAPSLLDRLRDAFARFDAINVVSDAPRSGDHIDYRLLAFFEYHDDGTASVRFRLQDVDDGSVVWTKALERIDTSSGRSGAEEKIVQDLATALLKPFGILRSHARNKYLTTGKGDPRYQCLLLTSDAFRSFDPAEHDQARKCLEQIIVSYPSLSEGFSYLAALCNREFLYGFGDLADEPKVLDRALQLARRGVELNPTSGRNYQVLSTVLFSRHETAAALAAVEKAMALNKYDTIIAGEYGGRLITSGQIARGMAILQRVENDTDVHPSWHHFYLFLGHYLSGDMTEATRQAAEMTSDTYPHGLVARALAAAANNDRDKAQAALKKLVALRPAWRNNSRSELEKYISSPEIVDRLVKDLKAAGLTGGA